MKEAVQKHDVIIVDDDFLITTPLATLLELEGAYNPITFNNPVDAIKYLENNNADLIISDFLMPQMNGIEFLKQAKSLKPNVSLILLTGYADKDSAIEAINDVGLYRYLEKPWDNDDLLLSIKNGIERKDLLNNLKEKVDALSEAKSQLEKYNTQLEILVKQRSSELLAIINHSADGIVTISKTGKIYQFNPCFIDLCGLSDENINDKSFDELFDKSNICKNLDENNDILIRDYNIINHKTGKEIPVEISFAPITTDIPTDKEDQKFVGIIRDITIQAQAERLRDDFIATLTHDLRTPLLAAIQTLQFFLNGSLGQLDDKQNKFLETMFHSNQDMLGLVNALLEVYKYESGQLQLCKDNFFIDELVLQCANEVHSLLEKKQLNLKIQIPQQTILYADKQEMRRVIANLLGNAIKHTEEKGIIIVKTIISEGKLILMVEDTGIGIPSQDIPHIFNRFSQGTSKKRSTGTGLGLYLSRQIIEAHNGKIWLESEEGKGSRFSFAMPQTIKEKVLNN